MQSSGEAVAADQTARHAARLLLSGPAGGLAGAAFAATSGGLAPRLLSFDMGGTSTDVALIDGEPRLTTAGHVAGFPVALPMVDMHTIGAGGGSLARVDAGGVLLVGPESAGAVPGPVCYGRGGQEPTVTDANLVLGRLDPECFLGGRMRLDQEAARRALGRLGAPLGLSPEETALGIVRIADEQMVRALRVISVQRGHDPRDFVLASFGGAGGLHVCALAESLDMTRALVPVHAGVLSALGMLVTPAGRTLTRAWLGLLETLEDAVIERALDALAGEGVAELVREGLDPAGLGIERSLDLRYRGQSHTLNLAWSSVAELIEAFHQGHAALYGHRLDLPVELVDLRVRVRARRVALTLSPAESTGGAARGSLRVHGIHDPVPVVARESLAPAGVLTGPAVIADAVSTTWLAPGWSASRDGIGNLVLVRGGNEAMEPDQPTMQTSVRRPGEVR